MHPCTHVNTLLLLAAFSGILFSTTNHVEQLTPQIAYLTRVAEATQRVPSLTRKKTGRSSWIVYSTAVCEHASLNSRSYEWPTNNYTYVDGYYEEFIVSNALEGFIQYGAFSSTDEAHAVLVYATTTTAKRWSLNNSLAQQLYPAPDEVFFGGSQACAFRRGTTCVHIAVYKGEIEEEVRMKLIIEIANRILAEIAAAETSE